MSKNNNIDELLGILRPWLMNANDLYWSIKDEEIKIPEIDDGEFTGNSHDLTPDSQLHLKIPDPILDLMDGDHQDPVIEIKSLLNEQKKNAVLYNTAYNQFDETGNINLSVQALIRSAAYIGHVVGPLIRTGLLHPRDSFEKDGNIDVPPVYTSIFIDPTYPNVIRIEYDEEYLPNEIDGENNVDPVNAETVFQLFDIAEHTLKTLHEDGFDPENPHQGFDEDDEDSLSIYCERLEHIYPTETLISNLPEPVRKKLREEYMAEEGNNLSNDVTMADIILTAGKIYKDLLPSHDAEQAAQPNPG